jgi:hypothetical protein
MSGWELISEVLTEGYSTACACPLTTRSGVFVHYPWSRDDDFRTDPLPFVERTSSHRLRWPYRLVSELIPRPLRDEPFL